MDPDMMQASMKMMRDNPALMQSAQKVRFYLNSLQLKMHPPPFTTHHLPTTTHHPPSTTHHPPLTTALHTTALLTTALLTTALLTTALLTTRHSPLPRARAHQMMEKMSPEELVASSKMAQQQMAKMSPEEMESAAKVRMGRGGEREGSVKLSKGSWTELFQCYVYFDRTCMLLALFSPTARTCTLTHLNGE